MALHRLSAGQPSISRTCSSSQTPYPSDTNSDSLPPPRAPPSAFYEFSCSGDFGPLESCSACRLVSGLFDPAWCPQGSSVMQGVSALHSFLCWTGHNGPPFLYPFIHWWTLGFVLPFWLPWTCVCKQGPRRLYTRVHSHTGLNTDFFAFLAHHTAWGIQLPDQISNLCPLHWKRGVLTTGPPGKAPYFFFFFSVDLANWKNKHNSAGLTGGLDSTLELSQAGLRAEWPPPHA